MLDSNNSQDDFTNAMIDGLKKSATESVARNERYEKIYEIERKKWPHNMGSMVRSEIPEELHSKLDECISASQRVARDACQTVELTEKYLQDNS